MGWPDAITAYEWIAAKTIHKLEGRGCNKLVTQFG